MLNRGGALTLRNNALIEKYLVFKPDWKLQGDVTVLK
jgi:hypothetical protein